MGYGYAGGWVKPSPRGMDDDVVQKLVDELFVAIDANKLKEMKSALKDLKLASNDNFPLYTQEAAPIAAYIYAKNNGKTKAAASLIAEVLKKDYTYDGFPWQLIDHLNAADFKIVIDDVLNVSTKWNLDGGTEDMYQKYPAEAEKFVRAGRLNSYAKGENRTHGANAVIANASGDGIVVALHKYYGIEYVEKDFLSSSRLSAVLDEVDKRDISIRKQVRKEYVYKTAIKKVSFDLLEKDYAAGLLDDQTVKAYADMMIGNYRSTLFVTLRNMKNEELRIAIIASNEELMAIVSRDHQDLMPKEVRDIFIF